MEKNKTRVLHGTQKNQKMKKKVYYNKKGGEGGINVNEKNYRPRQKGIMIKKKRKRNVNKVWWKKVVDYLTSDSYMYAPLLVSSSSSPPPSSTSPTSLPTKTSPATTTGPLDYIKRVTAAISTRNTTKKEQQTSDRPTKSSKQEADRPIDALPETSFVVGQQTIGHLEMLKRIVHRSSPPPMQRHCIDKINDFVTPRKSKEIGCSL